MKFRPTSFLAAFLLATLGAAGPLLATVDDALAYALEAMTPYVTKGGQGFTMREDTWGGDLAAGDQKAIAVQLFKGNEYWFCMGTDVKGATVSVHLYDREGNLVEESDAWQRDTFAGARLKPKKTGSYFAIVKVEKSPRERTHWGLVYSYK